MRAERVEIDAIGFERRVELHALERRGQHAETGVAMPVLLAQLAGLIEKAEIGAFDVEADRLHATVVLVEVREDGREQELDRAGLSPVGLHPWDVDVGGRSASQE